MAPSLSTVVFLIRHAESMKNLSDRFGDPRKQFTLTHAGIKASEELAVRLASLILPGAHERELIISTQEPRAQGTADILHRRLSLPLMIVNTLDPIDSGQLSGLTESDAWSMYPEIMKKKKRYRQGLLDGYELDYPDGEGVADFQKRVMKAFFSVVFQSAGDRLWIVGHQSTISAILSFFANQKEQRHFYHYFKLDFCRISKVSLYTFPMGHIDFINVVL